MAGLLTALIDSFILAIKRCKHLSIIIKYKFVNLDFIIRLISKYMGDGAQI